MSNTYLNELTAKFLITILTATTIGLFGWVWKTSAEIAIWKTQFTNMKEEIKDTEERIIATEGKIKDRFTRTQADEMLKNLEARLQQNIDTNHDELHEAFKGVKTLLRENHVRLDGRLDKLGEDFESELDDKYNRLDDRVRDLEKQAPELLNNDLRKLREQVREHEIKKEHQQP